MRMLRAVVTGIILGHVFQVNLTIARALIVPEEYSTIQQAISAAASGDTIEIKPGTYRETITIKNNINLLGIDPNKVIVQWDSNTESVIEIQNCRDMTVAGITFMHFGDTKAGDPNSQNIPVFDINDSSVTVTNCNIRNGVGSGIWVAGDNESEISECDVTDNARSGIAVYGEQARPTLRKNICSNNCWNGIRFAEKAGGLAEENICTKNKGNGISLMQFLTSPKVVRNTCQDNNGSGIWVGEQARGEIEDNICVGNGWHGISIADETCSPLVQNNRCQHNRRAGIYHPRTKKAIISSNISEDNGEIEFVTLCEQLNSHKFDQLEETADRLRSQKSTFSNGNIQLSYFYRCLDDSLDHSKQNEDSSIELINAWIKAKPDSITPRIVLAYFYDRIAWNARGGGWAKDVSEESWVVFREYNQKAWEVSTEAEKIARKDPHFYETYLEIAKGLSKSDEVTEDLFEKGIAIDREYYPIYIERAFGLMPRWGGKRGELAAFAQRSADRIGGDAGEIMYARIVASVLRYLLNPSAESFDDIGFSCEEAKQGHIKILEKYPEATGYLNSYCLLACLCRDKDTAKTLFDRIGDGWDKSVWRKEVHFNSYRDWAYGQGQPAIVRPAYEETEIETYGYRPEWIPIALILAGLLASTVVLFVIAAVVVIIIILMRRKNKQPKSGP
ncbi:MAG: right-handed parallel beta-helix repeat-containing protein [Planctomycetota bacterium]